MSWFRFFGHYQQASARSASLLNVVYVVLLHSNRTYEIHTPRLAVKINKFGLFWLLWMCFFMCVVDVFFFPKSFGDVPLAEIEPVEAVLWFSRSVNGHRLLYTILMVVEVFILAMTLPIFTQSDLVFNASKVKDPKPSIQHQHSHNTVK